MGAPKQKWTSEEEEALKAGIKKHGAGKWRTIQKDPLFTPILSTRSNIDLKDKWRNMNVSANGHGPREKTRVPKPKGVPAKSASSSKSRAVSTPLKDNKVLPVADSAKNSQDAKVPRYNTMIIEALTAMKGPNGSEIGAIYNFIEQKHEVPANFRRLLSSKLRRLVQQNKLEKVQKGYRLKTSPFATQTPSPKPKVPTNRPTPPQNTGFCNSEHLLEEAWSTAAYKIADAEAKSFLASEAVKELERVSRLAEEQEALLAAISEICASGEVFSLEGTD